MIATVEIADVGAGRGLAAAWVGHLPPSEPGLRWSQTAMATPLARTRPPQVGRTLVLAFWDDQEAAERHLERSFRTAGGFRGVLRPVRLFGEWPGIDRTDLQTANPDGAPVVVFTLARTRLSQLVRFLRASRPAERAAVASPAMRWGTASLRLPFLATVSVWSDGEAAGRYAHGRDDAPPAHQLAIDEQRRKDFHQSSAFVRFEAVRAEGVLDGVDLGGMLRPAHA